jgi:DNA polymerase III subunit gamma/tau
MTEQATGYRVLARKYRPKTFADLIGQEAMVRTLTNAFATGRIAQAYMLTGVRGIGKTTTARLIARALNYPPGPAIDMPEITAQCEAILESRHMDVIEMDAASNTGVDNMREIIDSVRYAPVQARIKVYIIDEVHMLSKSAFNALLKTLEEPPPHVKFVFATTEIRKVPVTILSRCQRFDLRRLDGALLAQHYDNICKLEQVEAEDEALRMIARAAEGSVRDGLSLLDQAIAYGNGHVRTADVVSMLGLVDRTQVVGLFDAVMSGQVATALGQLATQYEGGGDPQTILTDLASFVHYVTRMKVAPQSAQMDGLRAAEEKEQAKAFAEKLSIPALTRAWQMLLKGINETGQASQPFQAAEMLIIRLAHAASVPSGDDLLKLAKKAADAPRDVSNIVQRDFRPQGGETTGAGPVMTATAPAREQVSTSAPPPVAMAPFSSFEDIVKYVREKRDIKFVGDLERYVRPIKVAPGRFEIALEADAPTGLSNDIMRKLKMWTEQHWTVTVVKDGGVDTISARRQQASDSNMRMAQEHPDIVAVLAAFPGAKIQRVRAPEPPNTPTTEDTDEESQ